MNSQFFETHSEGDTLAFQHLSWLLGHPEAWLILLAWAILLAGGFKLARLLWLSGKLFWSVLLTLIFFVFVATYVWLSVEAFAGFVEGRDEPLDELLYLQVGLLMPSAASTVWIIHDWVQKKQQQ